MRTTFALRACVQVLLERNRGVWHTVTDLCMATAADSARVRNVLHQLVDAGTAHLATVAGVEHFGIGVEGVPPEFQTAQLSPRLTQPKEPQ
ncbi:MAG: hypothetical protein RL375_2617 [Pseudomonadota bacterium]|jgi:hypothetical protein